MSFNVFARFPLPTIALAVSAVLTGCGGGASDQESTSVEASATATASTTSSASTSTDTSPATTSSAPVSSGNQSTDDTDVVVASATTTSTSGGGVIMATKAASRSGVGVNLSMLNSYSPQVPTIDLMKKASTWITQCGAGDKSCTGFTGTARGYDTLEEASLQLDADGWVKSLPATSDSTVKYRTVTTKLAEGGVQQPGVYTVRYDGSGTITYTGKITKNAQLSTPGRDIVTIASDPGAIFLNITATNPSNYIRNIRVYMPGGACKSDLTTFAASAAACPASSGGFVPFESFPAGSVWHPAFIASIKGFRTLRFMDWGQTNTTPAVNWSDRTVPTARSWYTTAGVPLESMLDLASKVGADPWVNIPPYANDDYVHQWARDAHAHLAAGSKINVEFGNELWNWSFPAARWVLARAQATWPADTNSGNILYSEMNWYGLRLSQVCSIVKSEFGADASRVQCVANVQAANPTATDLVMQCALAQKTLGQPCYKNIDVIAIAPYFASYLQNNTAIAAIMNTWYSAADGGLSNLFEEINGTDNSGTPVTAPLVSAGTKVTTGAVAQTVSWMTAQHAVAAKYGLPMWAYEGGQSLVPTSTDTNMLNLMIAANRDARMGAAYQTMMSGWKSAGGQTFAFYDDMSVYGKGGMWGLRESTSDTTNPKWLAATQWRDQACWWAGC